MKTINQDLMEKLLTSCEGEAPKINEFDNVVDLSNNLDRNLFLGEEVEDQLAGGINTMIRFWNRLDDEANLPIEKRQPIKIYINNYGGVLTAGFSIIDTIKLSKTPVWTINIGVAYSAAFEIFIAGHRRIAYPSSSFLFHEGSVGVSGDAHKFRNYADFYNVQLQQAKEHILSCTKLTEEEYEKIKKDDYWLTAEQALEKGICDIIAKELI